MWQRWYLNAIECGCPFNEFILIIKAEIPGGKDPEREILKTSNLMFNLNLIPAWFKFNIICLANKVSNRVEFGYEMLRHHSSVKLHRLTMVVCHVPVLFPNYKEKQTSYIDYVDEWLIKILEIWNGNVKLVLSFLKTNLNSQKKPHPKGSIYIYGF